MVNQMDTFELLRFNYRTIRKNMLTFCEVHFLCLESEVPVHLAFHSEKTSLFVLA